MSTDRPSAMNWGATPAAAPRMYQDYLVPGMFEALTVRTVAHLGARAGMRVLDVACGTGALSRALTRAGATVTGLDLAPPMLAIARELSPEIELIEGSADAIPFSDGEFDAATCQQGLQFFPNRQLALTQIRRVVKPGGKVVVACWCDPNQGGIGAIARSLTKHAGEEVGEMMLAPFVINRESDLQGLTEEVGFSDVTVERETIEARFTRPRRVRTAGDHGRADRGAIPRGAGGRSSRDHRRGHPGGRRDAPGRSAGVPDAHPDRGGLGLRVRPAGSARRWVARRTRGRPARAIR